MNTPGDTGTTWELHCRSADGPGAKWFEASSYRDRDEAMTALNRSRTQVREIQWRVVEVVKTVTVVEP